jgi:hypothetical protein
MWDGETSPIEKQEAANGEEVEHGRVADEATSGGGEAASGRPAAALFTFFFLIWNTQIPLLRGHSRIAGHQYHYIIRGSLCQNNSRIRQT